VAVELAFLVKALTALLAFEVVAQQELLPLGVLVGHLAVLVYALVVLAVLMVLAAAAVLGQGVIREGLVVVALSASSGPGHLAHSHQLV
jgi:hypothetical protein